MPVKNTVLLSLYNKAVQIHVNN